MDSKLLIVINTVVPYGFEVIAILGYPAGLSVRFRFKREWVTEEFANGYEFCVGAQADIVLRDKESAGFYPLRHSVLKEVTKVGNIFYIECTMGKLYEYSTDKSIRRSELKKIQEQIPAICPGIKNNLPGEDMTPLVFTPIKEIQPLITRHQTNDDVSKQLTNFQMIVDEIGELSFYKKTTFIKIVDIVEKNSKKAATISNNMVNLKEQHDYEIKTYQTTKTVEGNTSRDFTLESDGKHINIVKGKQRMVGKYDIYKFIFRPNTNTSGTETFIDLKYPIDISYKKVIEPRITLPIKIMPSTKAVAMYGFALVVLVLLSLNTKVISASIGTSEKIIEYLAVVSWAVAIADIKIKYYEYMKRK